MRRRSGNEVDTMRTSFFSSDSALYVAVTSRQFGHDEKMNSCQENAFENPRNWSDVGPRVSSAKPSLSQAVSAPERLVTSLPRYRWFVRSVSASWNKALGARCLPNSGLRYRKRLPTWQKTRETRHKR